MLPASSLLEEELPLAKKSLRSIQGENNNDHAGQNKYNDAHNNDNAGQSNYSNVRDDVEDSDLTMPVWFLCTTAFQLEHVSLF